MTARNRVASGGEARHGRRSAFTLIELLIVIVIIVVLMALAFPAYQAIIGQTKVAQVRSEMGAINSAIADFKSRYNTEPPSRISFTTAAGGVPSNALGLAPGTKAILRKMFPEIDLTATSPVRGSLEQAGLLGEELKGTEALVFFLGGIRGFDDLNADGDRDAGEPLTTELTGFSKNPANPFVRAAAGSTSRTGPFFEFDSAQLSELPDDTYGADPGTTAQLVYADALAPANVYVYASTAETGSYRDGDTAATTDFPPLAGGGFFKAYRKTKEAGPFWNPNSYQLISPGRDGQYGRGGVFDPKGTNTLPTGPPAYSPAMPSAEAALRQYEADNLTNFTNASLGG